ncbi:MAG TPA: glycoside hydrolase family 2 TIM barrel-domain containing protein [Phycisphaerae bacterium]|nr:glycoside hydrolase family 2 TIM barrel-domain containing protein [Phycisphaerae bacterium]
MSNRLIFTVALLLAPSTAPALAQSTQPAPALRVYPILAPAFSQSLDGAWSFKYIPSLDPGPDAAFFNPSANISDWKTLPVPANWELHGFAEPAYYMTLKDGLGLYRRTFKVPATWAQNRRVILRFEGVAFAFTAWVNGKPVGHNAASAFNPTSLDITDALSPDPAADNTLAVEVTTKPLAWQSDVNDDWDLSGIFRDVNIFSVPSTHLEDLTTSTKVAPDGSATLSISAITSAPATLHAKLLAPNGDTAAEADLPRTADDQYTAQLPVKNPHLWTAESPALYHLQLSLSSNAQPLQSLDLPIGLREISISDGILKLNGRPIKLHGVDRHDEDPIHGRALTEADWQRDIKMMKEGNINFVRTSHSPPNSRFLQLCDEAGIYVLCEVPLAHFQSAEKNNPDYIANVMARVTETLTRDKNHPSVIAWSIGNENNIADLLFAAGRLAKSIDPSRPICYPTIGTYFDKDDNASKFPPFVDMFALHYPSNAMLKKWTQTLTRPTLLTEYAHANGLAAEHIQDQWDMMQAAPHFAGGAIWHFMDQGLLKTSPTPVNRSKPTSDVWLDPTHYYDMHGTDGQDGILYADRSPQPDFYETRKVYAPVQFLDHAANVQSGQQQIPLTLENRYDFRSLAGMKLAWSLQRNGAAIQSGEFPLQIPSHEKQTLHIPVTIPPDATQDFLTLSARVTDETGLQINETNLRLTLPASNLTAFLSSLPNLHPTLTDSPDTLTIHTDAYTLTANKKSADLTLTDPSGQTLLQNILPHAGRKLTEPERGRAKRIDMWTTSTLNQPQSPTVKVSQSNDTIHLEVSARYPRPNFPDQSFTGGYSLDIAPTGVITCHFSFTPTNAKGTLAEAGISLVIPAAMTEFRYIGDGPYPGYPGKDRLDDLGLFHLTRDDIRFQGNRRHTEIALLTNPSGAGLALLTTPADIAVERASSQTLLSFNAAISGLGEKGRNSETLIDASTVGTLSANFTLLPLMGAWPQPLTRIFGPAAAPAKLYAPFYYSYDQ